MNLTKLFQTAIFSVFVVVLFLASGGSVIYQQAQAYDASKQVSDSNPLPQVPAMSGKTNILLNAVSSVAAGSSVSSTAINRSFQATLNGASAVSATVLAEGSNNGTNWLTIATYSLTLAAPSSGSAFVAPYKYIRGNLTAISGTGETVTLIEAE